MHSTIRRAPDQGEVKHSERRLRGLGFRDASAQETLKDLEGGDWLLAAAESAIDQVMQRKVAASAMKIDAGLMTNQFKGIGHMSLRRVGLLPQDFFEEFIDQIRAHFQMDNDAERLDRAIEGATRCLQQIGQLARKGRK